jgi:hypothetical protein
VGGFFVGGPVGAFFGGLTGGAAMDSITTIVDSKVHNEYRPNGNIALVYEISNCLSSSNCTCKTNSDSIGPNAKKGKGKPRICHCKPHPAGQIFDLTAGLIFDGLAGKTAGDMVKKISEIPAKNRNIARLNEQLGKLEKGKANINNKLDGAKGWHKYYKKQKNIGKMNDFNRITQINKNNLGKIVSDIQNLQQTKASLLKQAAIRQKPIIVYNHTVSSLDDSALYSAHSDAFYTTQLKKSDSCIF